MKAQHKGKLTGAAAHSWIAGDENAEIIKNVNNKNILSAFGIPVETEVPVIMGYRLTGSYDGPTKVEDFYPTNTWDRNRRDVSNISQIDRSDRVRRENTLINARWTFYDIFEEILKR